MVREVRSLKRLLLKTSQAVDLLGEIVNQPTIASITEKFTSMIRYGWHEVLENKELLTKSSKVIYEEMMSYLKKKKRTAQHNISSGELSATKNRYCVVTGQTYTIKARPDNEDDEDQYETKRWGGKQENDCIVCSERGKKANHNVRYCPIWTNLTVGERKELVKCEKHIFDDEHTTDNCTMEIGKCRFCYRDNAHHWLMCDKLYPVAASTTSKAAKVTASDVLLKTLKVKTEKPGRLLGVLEDNASTDNYILEATAIELNLKPIRDIVLEIEGINSTKRINSKVYWVPLVDVKKRVHYVKCYSLEKITEDSQPINSEIYRKICKKVKVRPVLEHLEATGWSQCPVCFAPITQERLRSHLFASHNTNFSKLCSDSLTPRDGGGFLCSEPCDLELQSAQLFILHNSLNSSHWANTNRRNLLVATSNGQGAGPRDQEGNAEENVIFSFRKKKFYLCE